MLKVFMHFDIDPYIPDFCTPFSNEHTGRFIWRLETIKARNKRHASRLKAIFSSEGKPANLLHAHSGYYIVQRAIAFSLN